MSLPGDPRLAREEILKTIAQQIELGLSQRDAFELIASIGVNLAVQERFSTATDSTAHTELSALERDVQQRVCGLAAWGRTPEDGFLKFSINYEIGEIEE